MLFFFKYKTTILTSISNFVVALLSNQGFIFQTLAVKKIKFKLSLAISVNRGSIKQRAVLNSNLTLVCAASYRASSFRDSAAKHNVDRNRMLVTHSDLKYSIDHDKIRYEDSLRP